jgi:hypothetical protein
VLIKNQAYCQKLMKAQSGEISVLMAINHFAAIFGVPVHNPQPLNF